MMTISTHVTTVRYTDNQTFQLMDSTILSQGRGWVFCRKIPFFMHTKSDTSIFSFCIKIDACSMMVIYYRYFFLG